MALTGRAGAASPLLGAPSSCCSRRPGSACCGRPALLVVLRRRSTSRWPGRSAPLRFDRARRHGASGSASRATVALTGDQHRAAGGPRRLRDAWPPSAGAAAPAAPRSTCPPGERRRVVDRRCCPTRRGDRPAARVTVRSLGPLGLAGRQGSHAVPWRVRVLPPFTSRKHLPAKLARLRELDGRTAVHGARAGHRVRLAAGVRRGDDVRSIDWRATARRGDVVVRTWRPERDRRMLLVLDTGRTSAGPGRRRAPAGRRDGRRAAAGRAGRPGRRPGRPARLRPAGARAGCEGASAQPSCCPRWSQAMAPLEPALVETDCAAAWSRAVLRRRTATLAWSCCSPRWTPRRSRRGCCPCSPAHRAATRWCSPSVADPRVDGDGRRPRRRRGGLRRGRGRAGLAERRRVAARARRRGRRGRRRAPGRPSRPTLADAYLALKAAGRL